ncbi:MAG: hypothetical protein ACXVH5_09885 [Ilumatobacteraceae bacterium]
MLIPVLALGISVGDAAALPLPITDVTSVQPTRVLDTRIGLGAKVGPLLPGVNLPVTMNAPAGATSVMVNLTAVDAVDTGWIKAWPCDEGRPSTSSLDFAPGPQASANAAIVRLAAGRICLASNVSVQMVVDVTGWYTGTSDLTASSPNRLLDTRVTGNPMVGGQERHLKVAGTPGIGANASIAALNFTVDRPTQAGWVVAYPCGQPTNGSTVNFSAGEIVANFTLVGLSGGDVCIKSMVDLQLVVDSFGWSTGTGRLQVQSPTRLLDTRDNATWGLGQAAAQSTIRLRVAGRAGVPNTADAALLTVTVANPSGDGFVTVWPCDQSLPMASTINTFPGELRSNLALVKLSVIDGEACLRYASSNLTPTDLVVDAVGWFTGTAVRAAGPACQISGAAFCETFDAPAGGGTRTGDLDPVLWGVSRLGNINPGQQVANDIAGVSMAGCGTTAVSFTPADVRICDGQMFEAVNDGGGVGNLDTYPKQPFDFANRTGRVTFDVSADSDGSHGAWPEFIITDKPVPGTRVSISAGIPPGAANEVGFSLDGCTSGPGGSTGVGTVFVTKNGVYSELNFSSTGCVTKGSARSMNHFEVRLSQNHLEVWGTDAGGTALKQVAVADNIGLTFTKGLVWLNDVHYNARKAVEPCQCGTQFNHTFTWDNLGFDGPKTYRDLGFDVPDANVTGGPATAGDATRRVGFNIGVGPTALTTASVRRDQTPTGAQVVLNTYSFAQTIPSISINGNPYIVTPWPAGLPTYAWTSISIPVPLDQVHDGPNTITFVSGDPSTTVSNVSIILVAASAVP